MPGIISSAAASAAVKKVAETAAQDIYDGTRSAARGAVDKLRVQFGAGFSKYITRTYEKCRFVKTILHRIDPVPIESAYAQPTLLVRKHEVSGDNFVSELDTLKNVVLVGIGGSGKSMFLKHTFLDLCADTFGRIPLFIELREVNDSPSISLVDFIYDQWSALIPTFTPEQFEYALRKGKFTILLDALDEVDFQERDRISKQIIQMSLKYADCRFLLTSRPDERFSSWNEFYTAEVKPLSKAQVHELVRKIDFDLTIKKKFLKEVDHRLFKSHKEFLSNPLLCTMMLMTYNEFEEIPSKMFIFYQRAFDVLFSRHDKTKPSFQRKFYTKLAEDDFSKLFASFCLVSYLDGRHSFDRVTAVRYAEAAKKLDRMSVDSADFLRDLVESLSILLREGEVYSFLHRSFQEYFTASFLANRQVPRMDDLFLPIVPRFRSDSVIDLLIEMKKESFEVKYLKPLVARLRREIDGVGGVDQASAVLSLFVSHFSGSSEQDAISFRPEKWSSFLAMVGLKYFHKKEFIELEMPSKEWWDEIIHYCMSDSKIASIYVHGDNVKTINMPVAKIPDKILKRSRLYKCLVQVCKDLEQLDEQLERGVADRTDLVGDLLKQFE